MNSMPAQPGPPFAIALAVLLGIALVAAWTGRLPVGGHLATAALRALVQLALVSLVIAAVLSNVLWSAIFALAMLGVATGTSARRIGAGRCWPWAGLAIAAGVLPTLLVVFVSGAVPLTGAALVPIAGIIIGGGMTACSLTGRRTFTALRDEHGTYEAGSVDRPAADRRHRRGDPAAPARGPGARSGPDPHRRPGHAPGRFRGGTARRRHPSAGRGRPAARADRAARDPDHHRRGRRRPDPPHAAHSRGSAAQAARRYGGPTRPRGCAPAAACAGPRGRPARRTSGCTSSGARPGWSAAAWTSAPRSARITVSSCSFAEFATTYRVVGCSGERERLDGQGRDQRP